MDMALPMQISLEEVITMLLSRVESLAMSDENGKTRFNVITRALYKKGLITDEDITASVREEHRMLKELGMLQELPKDDVVKAVAEGILQWIRGDVDAIRQAMEEYDKRLKEYAREESRKPAIAVASSDVLHQLDRMAPPPGSTNRGSKLII
jgi:ATP/maltotriose-dependent transcriptional regulator MalT